MIFGAATALPFRQSWHAQLFFIGDSQPQNLRTLHLIIPDFFTISKSSLMNSPLDRMRGDYAGLLNDI